MQYAWDNSLHLSEDELVLVKALLRETANGNPEIASAAMMKLAKAVELPLRKGFFSGDTVGSIYLREDLEPGTSAKYPLDFVGPSGERDFAAFLIADEGGIPDRLIKGTEVAVDTFELGNAISWKLQYARDARWPMVERALKTFRDGFVHTVNNEGWKVILSAIGNRVDTQFATATGAAFTLGLLSEMQLKMKRGIEFARNELTDIYVSSEVQKDIRDFATLSGIDFLTQREIFQAVPRPDGNGGEVIIPTIYGVSVHEMKQLGVGREYTDTFDSLKGAHLAGFDDATDEIVVGLDLTPEGRQAYVMPVRRDLEMFEDPKLHREQKAGVYGWMELAFALLDDRRAILGWMDAS